MFLAPRVGDSSLARPPVVANNGGGAKRMHTTKPVQAVLPVNHYVPCSARESTTNLLVTGKLLVLI